MQSPIQPFDKVIHRIHPNIRVGIIAALREIFEQHKYSDYVLERMTKANPKWGARDRRLLAESVFEITRYWRLLLTACNAWEKQSALPYDDIVALYFSLKGIRENDDVPELIKLRRRYEQALSIPRVRESVTDWLYDYGAKQLGEKKWLTELTASNIPADVYIRANRLLTTKEKLLKILLTEEADMLTVPGIPDALKLNSRKNLFQTNAFKDGLFEIQDAGSQLIAPFLGAEPGMRVVDACAGGGGKTLHLAALMQNKGRIIALDIVEKKLSELMKRARRNGVTNVETRAIDSAKVIKRLAGSADRLLLDAPCSGSGVIKRNPDTKWKLSQETVSRLLETQKTILSSYAQIVKPEGLLVYATCSIFPSENENQVRAFLETHDNFILDEEKKILPSESRYDGFYMARLKRVK